MDLRRRRTCARQRSKYGSTRTLLGSAQRWTPQEIAPGLGLTSSIARVLNGVSRAGIWAAGGKMAIREFGSESGVMMEAERCDHIVSCLTAGRPLPRCISVHRRSRYCRGCAVLPNGGAIRHAALLGGEKLLAEEKQRWRDLAGCGTSIDRDRHGAVMVGWRERERVKPRFCLMMKTWPLHDWQAVGWLLAGCSLAAGGGDVCRCTWAGAVQRPRSPS